MENQLVIVDQAGPLVELAATLELATDFARASKAKTTLAAYGSDWRVFESCARNGAWARWPPRQKWCVASWRMRQPAEGEPAPLEGAWRPSATSTGRPGSKPLRPTRRSRPSCLGSGARLALRRSARKPRRVTSCLAWSAARAPRSANFATAPSCCLGSLAHSDDPSSWPLTSATSNGPPKARWSQYGAVKPARPQGGHPQR